MAEPKMARKVTYAVMIRCPNAEKAVFTGMVCDLKTFGALSRTKRLRCPSCGQTHKWSANDAWLRDRAYATGDLLIATFDATSG